MRVAETGLTMAEYFREDVYKRQPYAGTALAEYFMAQGKSVLIVYDDLSKHCLLYTSIQLFFQGRSQCVHRFASFLSRVLS